MFKFFGPAVLVMGNPTTALGADMEAYDLEEAAVNPGIRSAYAGDARSSGVPKSAAGFRHAPRPEFRLQLQNASKAAFETFLENLVVTESATPSEDTRVLGFGDAFEAIPESEIRTVGLIPLTQISQGVDAPDALWLPAGMASVIDGIQFTEVGENDQRFPYNVTIMGMKRDVDQAGDTIPEGNRIIFRGPPATLGLTWTVPQTL